MLYATRKRQKEIADREATGESFWTEDLNERTRGRLLHMLSDLAEGLDNEYTIYDLWSEARAAVLRDEGMPTLAGVSAAQADVVSCVSYSPNVALVFSVMESFYVKAADVVENGSLLVDDADRATLKLRLPYHASQVGAILREERVSFDFVDGRVIPLESLELHEEVVVPVTTLLGESPDYERIEKAYRAALEELHNGTPEDAITDAGTALQEALVLLGCDGNALGPLIKSAKRKSLLGIHDAPLVNGIESTMAWVSADRSTKGDAHNADDASREDAWLTVHVVGALILRLVRGGPR